MNKDLDQNFLLDVYLQEKRIDEVNSLLKSEYVISNCSAKTLYFVGLLNFEYEKYDHAVKFFQYSLNKNESHEAHFQLGILFAFKKQFYDAIDSFKSALKINASDVAFFNLGCAYDQIGDTLKSIESYKNAINLNKNFEIAWNNLGVCYDDLDNFDDAIAAFAEAIRLNPKYSLAHNNIGVSYNSLGKFEKAIVAFNAAIALDENYYDAVWNRSISFLSIGDYLSGFRDWEVRWKISDPVRMTFNASKMLPKIISKNSVIMVWSEQGYGDTIQFSRFVSLLKNKTNSKIILLVQRELVSLLSISIPEAKVISIDTNFSEYDYQIPLLSLPSYLELNSDDILPPLLIKTDSHKDRIWQAKFIDKAKLSVGLVWVGGQRALSSPGWKAFRRKSIPTHQFIFDSSDKINFYLLQMELKLREEFIQANKINLEGKVFDYVDNILDFSDTASFIKQLDLIITVDTAVAHLAASMNKNVWLLLGDGSCWRWSTESPNIWYPTIKIFRKSNFGTWDLLMREINSRLSFF